MPLWFWIAFHLGLFVVLAIDLVGFRRREHVVTIKQAIIWSVIWVLLSLGFNALVWQLRGDKAALDFFTGYVIEYSLSVDNIFVFVLIFTYFKVRRKYQHRVLVWGIVGALVMRGAMIWLGVSLVKRFDWILYIFGAFLLVTGVRMLMSRGEEIDLEHNFVLRLCRRWMPVAPDYHEQHFLVRQAGRWMLTPLALVLIVIDIMDLIFAVDSIPAVFAITQDEFIIYTSNICAILGLRSLYFVLAHVIDRFIYLRTGLALVLGFVGLKMIAARFVQIPNWASLFFIIVVLFVTIFLSVQATSRRRKGRHAKATLPDHGKLD
ncbi:MAG: TerC family protein [Verrucomicrobiota bacterium]|nr:TerC family protein [Verrucomicrobiota bacterium]